MSYELTLPLKTGALEIEFDTVDELEAQLAALDLPRIERAIRSTLRRKGPARRTPAKKAKKAAGRRKAARRT